MKRILSLVVALGVAALFSSAALAGADCNFHKTQAAVENKTEASKDVATTSAPEKTAADQVQTAQANQSAVAKSAPTKK